LFILSACWALEFQNRSSCPVPVGFTIPPSIAWSVLMLWPPPVTPQPSILLWRESWRSALRWLTQSCRGLSPIAAGLQGTQAVGGGNIRRPELLRPSFMKQRFADECRNGAEWAPGFLAKRRGEQKRADSSGRVIAFLIVPAINLRLRFRYLPRFFSANAPVRGVAQISRLADPHQNPHSAVFEPQPLASSTVFGR